MKLISQAKRFPLLQLTLYATAIIAAAVTLSVSGLNPIPGKNLQNSVRNTEGQFLDTLEATYQAGSTFEEMSGGQPAESVPAPSSAEPDNSPDSSVWSTRAPNTTPVAGYAPGTDATRSTPEFQSDQEPGTDGYELDKQTYALTEGQANTATQDKVASLRRQWDHRYDRVVDENTLLEKRVADTRDYFSDYFEVQYDRLDELHPGADNYDAIASALGESLSRQNETYRQWDEKATAVLATQRKIMTELDNVNILMQYLDDAADFDAIAKHQVSIGIHTNLLLADMKQLLAAGLELNATLGQIDN